MDHRERAHRRRFAQNDLADPLWRRRIVEAIAAAGPMTGVGVLEIGAGDGALTAPLLAGRVAALCALELDPTRVRALGRLVEASAGALRVVEADGRDRGALESALASLPEPRRVVGSLPYNAATPIIDALLDLGASFQDAHVIVQREVAQRLAAPPRRGDYGYLSLITQLRARVRYVTTIPPAAFHPRPRVDSALVRLEPIPCAVGERFPAMRRYLSAAFGQRRKMLRNALAPAGFQAVIERLAELGLHATSRAEELSIEDHVRLFLALSHGRT